ncbi:hypothetical protein BJX62DRAFT_206000 [Aspergillus germanicus]
MKKSSGGPSANASSRCTVPWILGIICFAMLAAERLPKTPGSRTRAALVTPAMGGIVARRCLTVSRTWLRSVTSIFTMRMSIPTDRRSCSQCWLSLGLRLESKIAVSHQLAISSSEYGLGSSTLGARIIV